MNTSELFGKEVMDVNINRIGKVSDIEFSTSTWKISRLIIKAGLAKKHSVGVEDIDRIGDGITLNIEEDKLK